MANAKAAGAKAAWQNLTGGLGYMGISLNSRNHTGDALEAMVDWVNNQGRFNWVRIGLSDTLNRFNIASESGMSLPDAFNAATCAGNIWLLENQRILDKLEPPHEVVRWTHWLNNHSDDVQKNKVAFTHAYKTDDGFRHAVHADIERFTKRRFGLSVEQLDQQTLDTSLRYLIEEAAVYSVIFDKYPATAVYPGKQLECFKYLRENRTEDLPQGISNTGHIRLAIHGMKQERKVA